MSNVSDNKRAVAGFRRQLKALTKDIGEIDIRILNESVNAGLRVAKQNTPVLTGFMKKSWGTMPARKTRRGAEKALHNAADYASFVNDGHRIVDKQDGKTVGFVEGRHIFDSAENAVWRRMRTLFSREVRRINEKYNK